MENAVFKIKLQGHFHDKESLRVEAYSTFDIAIATLQEFKEIEEELFSPVQGWGSPLEYSGLELNNDFERTVKVEDETGKFPLNADDASLWNVLLEELDVEFSIRQSLSDALLDWVDEDELTRLNGAENDFYESLTPPYVASNSPIQSQQELFMIKGFTDIFINEEGNTNETYQAYKESTSAYSSFPININTAPPHVIGALARLSNVNTDLIDEHLLGLDNEAGTEDDLYFGSIAESPFAGNAASQSLISVTAKIIKITVTITKGDSSFILTGIVDVTKKSEKDSSSIEGVFIAYPFTIIDLSENRNF